MNLAVIAYTLLVVACVIIMGFAFGFVTLDGLNAAIAALVMVGSTIVAHFASSPKKEGPEG